MLGTTAPREFQWVPGPHFTVIVSCFDSIMPPPSPVDHGFRPNNWGSLSLFEPYASTKDISRLGTLYGELGVFKMPSRVPSAWEGRLRSHTVRGRTPTVWFGSSGSFSEGPCNEDIVLPIPQVQASGPRLTALAPLRVSSSVGSSTDHSCGPVPFPSGVCGSGTGAQRDCWPVRCCRCGH